MFNHLVKARKSRQLITALEDAVDRAVSGLLGICENVTVDVGEGSELDLQRSLWNVEFVLLPHAVSLLPHPGRR